MFNAALDTGEIPRPYLGSCSRRISYGKVSERSRESRQESSWTHAHCFWETMSFIANQRILLRNPLVRLYQDIETFQYRAVTDTYDTIHKMESARTAYRAALLWMKDISAKLDPDTYKQLERFRKVQSHVRRCKGRFEKIKIDTYQKIDMLSASRVNMFSHSLGLYQKEWLSFYEKSSKIMNEVNNTFTGYQYYDFNISNSLLNHRGKPFMLVD